jgi:hypothetical protein
MGQFRKRHPFSSQIPHIWLGQWHRPGKRRVSPGKVMRAKKADVSLLIGIDGVEGWQGAYFQHLEKGVEVAGF